MADLSGSPKKDIVSYGGSSSCRDLSTRPPAALSDLRCYSASYAHFHHPPPLELQQSKRASSKASSSFRRGWSFSDPEFQRKKRVASYKSYSMQGKVRDSLKKSFRWVKDKYNDMLYGFS